MEHSVTVNGELRAIKYGKANIDGIAETIKYGKTNIDGIVETISFGSEDDDIKSFTDTPWSEIVKICREANVEEDLPQNWKAGDTHTLRMYDSYDDRERKTDNYTDYEVVIIGMWHDYDSPSQNRVYPLTLQFKECFADAMKPGTSSYFSSEIHDFLVSLYEGACIEEDVDSGLVEVYKEASMDEGGEPTSDYCYFFLLDAEEVFGGSSLGEYDLEFSSHYEYYATGGSKVKTRLGSPTTWLLRDKLDDAGEGFAFAAVSGDGNLVSSYANVAYGIAPAFCLG